MIKLVSKNIFLLFLLFSPAVYAQQWSYIVNPHNDYLTMCVAPTTNQRFGRWEACDANGTCNNAGARIAQCSNRFGGSAYYGIPVNKEGQVLINCTARFGYTEAAAVCIAGILTTTELERCFQVGVGGRGCFGDSNTITQLIRNNWSAAVREPNVFQQHFRATTGVSIEDIRNNGPLGGNSDLRSVCDAIAGLFGGRC